MSSPTFEHLMISSKLYEKEISTTMVKVGEGQELDIAGVEKLFKAFCHTILLVFAKKVRLIEQIDVSTITKEVSFVEISHSIKSG